MVAAPKNASALRAEVTPLAFSTMLKTKVRGQFLFYGEESFLKEHYRSELRKNVLSGIEDSTFSHKKIDCSTFNAEKILGGIISAPSLFDDGSSLTLCELYNLDFNSLKEAELRALVSILAEAEEYNDTVLLVYADINEFDHEALNPKSKNKKSYTAVCQYLTPINFKIEDETKISKWISRHFSSEKLQCEVAVIQALIDRCGCSMHALKGEISKLVAYVHGVERTTVTIEDVQTVCTYNIRVGAFDFANALLEKKPEKAFLLLTEMKNKKEDPINISGSIIRVFTDIFAIKSLTEMGFISSKIAEKLHMNEYAVSIRQRISSNRSLTAIKKILQKCRETDAIMKSSYQDQYSILNELVIFATIQ